MHVPIVPACIPRSEKEVVSFVKQVEFVNEIQIDVVDGKFVGPVSWPYVPAGLPQAVKAYTDPFTLEVDLMVSDPIAAAEQWLEAGADMLVFHVESTNLDKLKQFAEYTDVSIGISYNASTEFSEVIPYIEMADYIQIMGIKEVGSQGQPFDENVFKRIAEVKQNFPGIMISIDGGVSLETAPKLVEAGAHRLVSGSAILNSPNPQKTYTELQQLVS